MSFSPITCEAMVSSPNPFLCCLHVSNIVSECQHPEEISTGAETVPDLGYSLFKDLPLQKWSSRSPILSTTMNCLWRSLSHNSLLKQEELYQPPFSIYSPFWCFEKFLYTIPLPLKFHLHISWTPWCSWTLHIPTPALLHTRVETGPSPAQHPPTL